MVSSERVWVSVAISPSSISFLITSALPRPRLSATSRTVAPEAILGAGSGLLDDRRRRGGSSSSGRRRRPPRRRGGRCGGACGIWSRRDACESITTRRRFFCPPAPSPAGLRRAHRLRLAVGGGLRRRLPSAAPRRAAPRASASRPPRLAAVGRAPPPLAAASAFRASASSTLEAATFASMPAAFSAARTSLLVRPSCLGDLMDALAGQLSAAPPRSPRPRPRPRCRRRPPGPRAPSDVVGLDRLRRFLLGLDRSASAASSSTGTSAGSSAGASGSSVASSSAGSAGASASAAARLGLLRGVPRPPRRPPARRTPPRRARPAGDLALGGVRSRRASRPPRRESGASTVTWLVAKRASAWCWGRPQ